MQVSNSSTEALKAKLKKLDLVYHITEDVQMRYKIIQAEDEIKEELRKRRVNWKT